MKRFEWLMCLVALAGFAGCGGSSAVVTGPTTPSSPSAQAITHIVIMVQENRSFNNVFAGFPGANTAMQGLCKPELPRTTWCKTAREVTLKAIPLATGNYKYGGKDICHAHLCLKIECDLNASHVCQNDGFDLIGFGEVYGGPPAKLYPYAYIRRRDIAAYWKLAEQYSLADDMFSTDTASSFIAHQELISGTVRLNDEESLTDEPDASPWGCDAPTGAQTNVLLRDGRELYAPSTPPLPFPCFTQYKTMADLLDATNTSWRYYVMPITGKHADYSGGFWNAFDAIKAVRYSSDWDAHIIRPNYRIFSDVKTGALPAVSWVVPTLYDSDHPASGCNGGPWWVTQVVNAIGTSRYWKNTAILLLWDDWGGWYDNVPPPQVSYVSYGFRVPLIVISPYARPHYVSHTQYELGSILKFVEQTFGLGSLGASDATSNSIADIFDFNQPPNKFTPAPLPSVMPCGKIDEESPAEIKEIIKDAGGPPE